MEKITKKRKEVHVIDRRKKLRRDQLISWMERNVSFVEEIKNQEMVMHMGSNATSAKRRITGQAVV